MIRAARNAPYCPLVPNWILEAREQDGLIRYVGGFPERFCIRCTGWFPMDTEFFRFSRLKPDNMENYCKACEKESRDGIRVPRDQLEAIAA